MTSLRQAAVLALSRLRRPLSCARGSNNCMPAKKRSAAAALLPASSFSIPTSTTVPAVGKSQALVTADPTAEPISDEPPPKRRSARQHELKQKYQEKSQQQEQNLKREKRRDGHVDAHGDDGSNAAAADGLAGNTDTKKVKQPTALANTSRGRGAGRKAKSEGLTTNAPATVDVNIANAALHATASPFLPPAAATPSHLSSHDSSQGTLSYWLLKAEPNSRIEKGKDMKFSIDDLAALTSKGELAGWDGVRNYAARNNLKMMKKGDLGFFYHSNCKEPGIVGIMEIAEGATIDETAFDPAQPYYDPTSIRANPKWFLVKVRFVRKLSRVIGLQEIKSHGKSGGRLEQMQLIKMSRLSVSGVRKEEWDFILELEKEEL